MSAHITPQSKPVSHLDILSGGSALAMFVALLVPGQAAAQQAQPGDSRCPIVGGVATCSGDLSGGIRYFDPNPLITELRVENVTGLIAPPNGIFAIGLDRANTDFRLIVADGVVINTFDSAAIANPAQGIVTIASSGRDTFIDSGAIITADGRGMTNTAINAESAGAGADVTIINRGALNTFTTTANATGIGLNATNAGGLFQVTNSGTIRATTTGAGAAAGITFGGSAAGGITITNSGAFTISNTTGQAGQGFNIQAGASPGDIRIDNSGTLSVTTAGTGERDVVTAGILANRTAAAVTRITNRGDVTLVTGPTTIDSDFVGAAAAIVANNNGGGSIIIDNDANLSGTGQDTGGMTLFVANGGGTNPAGVITVTNAGTIATNGNDVFGIITQARGSTAQLSVTSAAAITMANANNANGLFLLNEANGGSMTAVNTGAISASGTGFARGIGVSSFGAPTTGTYALNVTNSGNITLDTPFAQGFTNFATRDDTVTLTFNNTGTLDLRNTTNVASRGISATFDLVQTGIATQGASTANIVNDGNITMGAGNAIFATATNLTIDNSGDLSTSGALSAVMNLTGLTTGTTGGVVNITTDGDLVATGAGSDGIRLTNAGSTQIMVAAATRVASGTGADATAVRLSTGAGSVNVTNSGTIESVAGVGVLLTGGTRANLNNSGTISGGANAIDATGFVASGAITSGVIVNNNNGGRIIGNVALSGSGDVYDGGMGSLLTGNIATGGGSDSVELRDGTIAGAVSLGAGSDVLIVRNGVTGITAVDGGADGDTVRFGGGGTYAVDFAALPFTAVERFNKIDAGTVTITGAVPALGGTFEIDGGTLVANGTFTASAFELDGGTLAGTGAIGATTAGFGRISPGGDAAGTLTAASLALGANTRLLYDLGTAGTVGGADNDLLAVTGNLTLDGTLDIDAAPTFGPGVYRLINYGGALTDNGLVIGMAPAGAFAIQTAVAGQVNLVNGTSTTQFWDGGGAPNDNIVAGGSGTWNAANINWTNMAGSVNGVWGGNFGVFSGAAGTVTIEGAQNVAGLQFTTTGYTLAGGTGGNIVFNAAETPIRNDMGVTATISAPLSGAGALLKRDAGTLILGGVNSYAGGTQIREGVLQVAADTALGAAAGGVTIDGGTLQAGGALTSARGVTIGAGGGTIDTQGNAVTLSGVIGGGALTKAGSGTLTLSGNSAARTGATAVSAGTLALTGSLGGALTVASGATLTGTGTVGSLTVNGAVAPTGAGTLAVSGNIVFAAGSTYRVDLAAAGGTDRINAGGTATLAGTVAVTALDPELSYTDNAVYRILNATGGRTGTFAGLTESSAFLDFALGYDPTGAFVTVDVVRQFPAVAQSFNQTQSATGLRAFPLTAGSDSLAVYNAVLFLDAASARAAFDAASGEIHATTAAGALRQASLAADRFIGRSNIEAAPGWSLWGGGQLSDGTIDGDGNAAKAKFDGYGGLIGIDWHSENGDAVFGAAVGYGQEDLSLRGRASTADADSWIVAAYGRFGSGGPGFGVSGTLGYASSDVDTTRRIAFGTIARTATANYDIKTVFGSLEARYGFGGESGGWSYGPLGSLSYFDVDGDRFAEAGADALNLAGRGVSGDLFRYGGGGFAKWSSEKGWFEATAQYVTSDRDAQASRQAFAGAPGTTFSVLAPSGREEGGLFSLAGEARLGGGFSLGGGAHYFSGKNGDGLQGTATLRFSF